MTSLEAPDSQPYTARLAGAGSLRKELEAALQAAPSRATAADYRRLLIDENVAGKASANARMWMWLRLKLRYALDSPGTTEFQAFRWAMSQAPAPQDRGLVASLMMARTDRLFREVVTTTIAPELKTAGRPLEASPVRADVTSRMREGALEWSPKSVANIANHVLSSLKDFGIVAGSRERRTVRISITPIVATFAAMLGRAQGLTDRQVLDSPWFRFLGASAADAAAALHAAAGVGLVTFRMQADVVELQLPDVGEAA